MARTTYRRTERGRKAWDTEDRAVPLEYRRVLGHMGAEVDCDTLRVRVGYSEAELSEVMAGLEALGLAESLGDERGDLDFTATLKAADLRAAAKKP